MHQEKKNEKKKTFVNTFSGVAMLITWLGLFRGVRYKYDEN